MWAPTSKSSEKTSKILYVGGPYTLNFDRDYVRATLRNVEIIRSKTAFISIRIYIFPLSKNGILRKNLPRCLRIVEDLKVVVFNKANAER